MSDDRPPDDRPAGASPAPADDPTRLDPAEDVTRVEAPVGADDHASRLPGSIGQYRILRKLGSGGMGVVYEAEQAQPRRRVALKVVRGGAAVDEYQIRLFQREAATLARLEHPGIAAIYESGRAEDGCHFFAMELVRGRTLGEWLHDKGPVADSVGLRRRLDMFRSICQAVHYAHQRGVIHRDLKPANIFVNDARGDGIPEVKILDFGLARIMDADGPGATMMSEAGAIKGTLAYMSPEQARGDVNAIDVRTDVYSLGVVLYEMLAGTRPYDISGRSVVDALRVICDTPAEPLQRNWAPGSRLDPDVQTIVGKAIEKAPDDRYASVAGLAGDVARYLSSQPIIARPPSTVYQLRKLVARNKLPTAFLATLIVMIVAFGVWMSVLYTRAEKSRRLAVAAREAATLEAQTANRVTEFLTDLFKVSDPGEARGNSVTAREVLDRGSAEIEAGLATEPELQARLMETMGLVYRNLGLYDPSVAMLRRALEVRQGVFGPESLDAAQTSTRLAGSLLKRGRIDDARPLLESALAVQSRLAPDDPATARTLNNLGMIAARLDRDFERARELWEEALRIRERALGPSHPDVAKMLGNLSLVYNDLGEHDLARQAGTRAIEIYRATYGDDHPDVGKAEQQLSSVLLHAGDLPGALAHARAALAVQRAVLEPGHPDTAPTLRVLGKIHAARGELPDARDALERSLTVYEAAVGREHRRSLQAREALIDLVEQQGDHRRAAELLRVQVDAIERRRGPEHPDLIAPLRRFAIALRAEGDEAAAGELERRAAAIERSAVPSKTATVAAS